MSEESKRSRRQFNTEQKVAILRRHLVEQAVFHHEQRALHAAELQTAEERYTAFRSAATAAGELVERRRAATAPPSPGDEAFPGGTRGPVGRQHSPCRIAALLPASRR